MADKDKARILARDLGIPLLPGYENSSEKEVKLLTEAKKIGFPVLLKASAGGGGKGMRKVFKENEFLNSLREVRREAKNIFGDDRIIIEKYVESGRHIEVQILGIIQVTFFIYLSVNVQFKDVTKKLLKKLHLKY